MTTRQSLTFYLCSSSSLVSGERLQDTLEDERKQLGRGTKKGERENEKTKKERKGEREAKRKRKIEKREDFKRRNVDDVGFSFLNVHKPDRLK